MTNRTSAYPIDPMFLDRWSPRAYDGKPLPEADLLTILEAARWAPSAYNVQPWRFLYAINGDANWARFLGLLVPFNQSWVKNAGALIYVISDSKMGEGEKQSESHSHSFDAGAASALLALQALKSGYHAHGMSGVDFPAAQASLGVPERFRVEAAFAIGMETDAATLPDGLREREVPSDRKPLDEVAYAGNFRG